MYFVVIKWTTLDELVLKIVALGALTFEALSTVALAPGPVKWHQRCRGDAILVPQETCLPHMIRSRLKSLLRGEGDQALLTFVDEAVTSELRRALLELRYSQELSLLYLLQDDVDRAEYYIRNCIQMFLQVIWHPSRECAISVTFLTSVNSWVGITAAGSPDRPRDGPTFPASWFPWGLWTPALVLGPFSAFLCFRTFHVLCPLGVSFLWLWTSTWEQRPRQSRLCVLLWCRLVLLLKPCLV